VRIRVNGDPVELPAEVTILQLLEQLHIDPRLVAVEHNLSIIKRVRYESTLIADGDQIEIVNFVGGGSAFALRASARQAPREPGTWNRTSEPGTEPENLEPWNLGTKQNDF
jgi:sulfur carrier protein